MLPVLWLNFNEDAPPRGYWDQGLLEDLLAGKLWQTPNWPDFQHFTQYSNNWDGAVVVVPGRQNAKHLRQVQNYVSSLKWCVLIITGDEENEFQIQAINHPNIKKWRMTPGPWDGDDCDMYLGSGYPPGMREHMAALGPALAKDLDSFFSGQVTHDRRTQLIAAVNGMDSACVHLGTRGFTQGLPQEEYWDHMARAKNAPCPGGPVSADSFRLFEALEAGCIPFADKWSGREIDYDAYYWLNVFQGKVPFKIVDNWAHYPENIYTIGWEAKAARIGAWYVAYKRKLAETLIEHITATSGLLEDDDGITVLIPTSPIPSHPSTEIIEETIASIKERLPYAEIIIMCDGVRDEQVARKKDYQEFLRRLVRLCTVQWTNVQPVIYDQHLHQGAMTRATLPMVRTSRILFVEHDTPLVGDVPWAEVASVIDAGEANVIRLHHEASILEPHKYLMLSEAPERILGVPLTPTVQWSQRPHLASTNWYRWMLNEYFSPESRTMIEDVIYGVLETHHREEGREGWEKFRLYIYSPEGDMKRSTHTDGRAGESKYSMLFDYGDGEAKWAPHPGVRE